MRLVPIAIAAACLCSCVTGEFSISGHTSEAVTHPATVQGEDPGAMSRHADGPTHWQVETKPCRPGAKNPDGTTPVPDAEIGIQHQLGGDEDQPHDTTPFVSSGCEPGE